MRAICHGAATEIKPTSSSREWKRLFGALKEDQAAAVFKRLKAALRCNI